MRVEYPVRKETVELLKVEDEGDYKRRFYGCGYYTNRLFQRSITDEPVEIKDGFHGSKKWIPLV